MNALQITPAGIAVTSLLASLLIAVYIPLRPLLRRVAGSQWLCVLWLALLARLLVPLPLESRWSVFNRWQKSAVADAVEQGQLKIKVSVVDAAPRAPIAASPIPAPAAFHVESTLNALWLAGFATSLLALAWRWRRTRRLAAATEPAGDQHLLNIYDAIPEKWRRRVELRVSGSVEVPTLAGILRPHIWMPREWPAQFTDEELRHVLLHELGHARRGDLAVQWLFALAGD